MGNVSYSAHISNGKSAITSKKALAGVAKHNLRKYKSADYSSDNIRLIYGTTDLFQDVKRVYHREFDDVVKEYNSRQKREDRKIKDYFEHVAGLNQDMAVEIIFQCGDKKYWDEHWKNKNYMSEVFDYILECLQKLLPEFKIANAVIHFDEASPHMHVVGIPVWEGAKRGLSKKVSKRNVFTPQTLSVILQDKLRAEASYGFECYFKEQLAEKKKGRNHDLSVTEYKVAQESRKLTDIKQQNNEEQEKNTKLRSNNASISYQIATQEQRHSRNLDVIAADEDRLETVRSSINAAETEYAKYADMIMDKKNNLELLSSKESELIERTKIAESVFDMFRQSGTDDVREKLIDVMYENQKLREENTTLQWFVKKIMELDEELAVIENLINQKCQEIPHAGNILEISGIGENTLSGILADMGDISRFDDVKEIQKLSGLGLVACSSGKHKGETKISHRGRKRLRYWLFQAAKSAVAHAEEFKELHVYYTTRPDNPLKKMQSLIVIACKLLRIVYTILKKGTVYDPKKMLMDIRRPEKKEAIAA